MFEQIWTDISYHAVKESGGGAESTHCDMRHVQCGTNRKSTDQSSSVALLLFCKMFEQTWTDISYHADKESGGGAESTHCDMRHVQCDANRKSTDQSSSVALLAYSERGPSD